MDISLSGIVAIVGNYGSGKTEVAINLAVKRKRAGLDVRIADLDLVNPYFRTREAQNALEALGIKVILPPQEFLHADLPILSPTIAGMIAEAAKASSFKRATGMPIVSAAPSSSRIARKPAPTRERRTM